MSLQTATRFRWGAFTKTLVIRLFVVSIFCSLLLAWLSSLGAFGVLLGSIVSVTLVGTVLLWTVAEMIEDGLKTAPPRAR